MNITNLKFLATESKTKKIPSIYCVHKAHMNIHDGPVFFLTVTHDIGSFQPATSPSSRSSLCSSIQPAERGLCVEDSYGPGPKVMATSSAYIPLARTQELDCF